jgi:hypothetical protein
VQGEAGRGEPLTKFVGDRRDRPERAHGGALLIAEGGHNREGYGERLCEQNGPRPGRSFERLHLCRLGSSL